MKKSQPEPQKPPHQRLEEALVNAVHITPDLLKRLRDRKNPDSRPAPRRKDH